MADLFAPRKIILYDLKPSEPIAGDTITEPLGVYRRYCGTGFYVDYNKPIGTLVLVNADAPDDEPTYDI